VQVIAELRRTSPDILVGAGTVLNEESALRCATLAPIPGIARVQPWDCRSCPQNRFKLVMAGALTPTELMAALDAGADFIKVFPCGNLGGPNTFAR